MCTVSVHLVIKLSKLHRACPAVQVWWWPGFISRVESAPRYKITSVSEAFYKTHEPMADFANMGIAFHQNAYLKKMFCFTVTAFAFLCINVHQFAG